MEPRFGVFTVPQVSKLLQMSDDRVYRLCQSGKMPGAINIDGQWRVASATFYQAINGRAMWPAKESAGDCGPDADRT